LNQHSNSQVRIADDTLNFRDLVVPHADPTGALILQAAGVTEPTALLLQRLPSGDLESIRLSETPNLKASNEFIVSFGDRTFNFVVNASQMVWHAAHISGATLRRLAMLEDSVDLLLLRPGAEPEEVQDHTIVDLASRGVEKFVTRPRKWKLRVQAVTLDFDVPEVMVGDAMTIAGFDPKKAWKIYLLVAGKPKKEVDVNYIVDLRTPGIERIRLMQRNVDNGEATAAAVRREFALLPVDVKFLDGTGLKWETVKAGERRWLVIKGYETLPGYQPASVTLALDIPKDYPQAQIDMFYFSPVVSRCDGAAIPNTHVTATIDDVQFQGWSRHRTEAHKWDPNSDNVGTHFALVEHSLAREFGE
jgi:Prokaryotic E2 family E/Multiubiquitin